MERLKQLTLCIIISIVIYIGFVELYQGKNYYDLSQMKSNGKELVILLKSNWGEIRDTVSAFSTVAVFILGYYFYKKYHVTNDVLKEQLATVKDLLEQMKSIQLYMIDTQENKLLDANLTFPLISYTDNLEPIYAIQEDYEDKICLMNIATVEKLNQISHKSTLVFLPISISEALQDIPRKVWILDIKNIPKKDYILIGHEKKMFKKEIDYTKEGEIENWVELAKDNYGSMSLEDLLNLWAKVMFAIEEWNQTSTAGQVELNLPF